MKTFGILIACLLAMICSNSFSQTVSVTPTSPTKITSEVQAKLDLINQSQGQAVSEWEQQQIANGASYVILQNGEKAFFATTPPVDSSAAMPVKSSENQPAKINANNSLPEPK